MFVDENQESLNECTFSCPEEGVAGVFASIEEQTDLLCHSLRSGGVRGCVIQVAFPLGELPSDEVSHGHIKEATEEVAEEQQGVDLDFTKHVVDPGRSILRVARSEHKGSRAWVCVGSFKTG